METYMTVEELISLNQMIVDLTITVRKDGALLDQLSIGPDAGKKPRFPLMVPKDEKHIGSLTDKKESAYIQKSINAWDDGHDYWQVKPNRIPKAWLALEVDSWESYPAYYGNHPRANVDGHRNVSFHGERVKITALPSGQKLSVPEEKPKAEEFDGQMSFEDWNYEVMTI